MRARRFGVRLRELDYDIPLVVHAADYEEALLEAKKDVLALIATLSEWLAVPELYEMARGGELPHRWRQLI